jgi:hypothetical protein
MSNILVAAVTAVGLVILPIVVVINVYFRFIYLVENTLQFFLFKLKEICWNIKLGKCLVMSSCSYGLHHHCHHTRY